MIAQGAEPIVGVLGHPWDSEYSGRDPAFNMKTANGLTVPPSVLSITDE
jgi:hypothetical protein